MDDYCHIIRSADIGLVFKLLQLIESRYRTNEVNWGLLTGIGELEQIFYQDDYVRNKIEKKNSTRKWVGINKIL